MAKRDDNFFPDSLVRLCQRPEDGCQDCSKIYALLFHLFLILWCSQMLGNLKNPPEPFGDVIRTHYRLKSQVIIAQLDRWLAMDDGKATVGDTFSTRHDGGGSSNGFKKDVEEMQQLLRQLQDGTFKVDK